MKERYEIIKKFYPNYLILFYKKGKYKYYGLDKEIVSNFSEKNINKIILNNLTIEVKEEYQDDEYEKKYAKTLIIMILKDFKKGGKSNE